MTLRKILLLTCDPQMINLSPNNQGIYEDFQFVLEPKPGDTYEAVVCYEKIERPMAIRVKRGNTIFIPGEPETIKSFSTDFINQFNHLLTFRMDLALRFKGSKVMKTNCLTPWRIGLDENLERANAPRTVRSYDTINTYQPSKAFDLSMVVSNKTGTPLQRTRQKFAQIIQQYLGQTGKFQLFGRGIRDIPDSAIALDNFRFSICMENSELPDYFTEKVVNAFLTDTIPLYWGCTNIKDYFETFQNPLFLLDPYDMRGSMAKIQFILQNSEALYVANKEALLRDKAKCLNEYHILARVLEFLPEVNKAHQELYLGNEELEMKEFHPDQVGYFN